MKARIISSEKCPKCKFYLRVLKKQKFSNFEVFNADDASNQSQLDAWKISHMPVVQIIEEDKVLFQFQPGQISPRAISYKIKELNHES